MKHELGSNYSRVAASTAISPKRFRNISKRRLRNSLRTACPEKKPSPRRAFVAVVASLVYLFFFIYSFGPLTCSFHILRVADTRLSSVHDAKWIQKKAEEP